MPPFGDDRNIPAWMRLIRETGHARVEKERIGQPGGFVKDTLPAGLPISPPSGGIAEPSDKDTPLPPWQFEELLRALWRRSDTFIQPFLVGVAAIKLRPVEKRKYLFIQNQSAVNNMALGINEPPGALTGVPVNGLVIQSGFGFYEPLVVPQGEIWIIAAAAGTPGVIIYAA